MKSKAVCAVVTEETRSRALCCAPFPDSGCSTLCFKEINTEMVRKLFAVSRLRKVVTQNDKAKLASVNFFFNFIYFFGDIPFAQWFTVQC